ncbi:MAG: hypothetical protein AAB019_07725 [Planctomycetota bacterium]
MEQTRKQKFAWRWSYLVSALIIGLAGYWAFNDTSHHSFWVTTLLLGFFGIFVVIYLLIRFLLTKQKEFRKKRRFTLMVAILAWLALFSGFVLGRQYLDANIEYTKKQAEPIIQALENYYQTKGSYPERLQELGIPIPKALLGGEFGYHSSTHEGKPYFGLSIDLGIFVDYYYSSSRKGWTLMD